jgi:flagellar P-ring protein precursor FlgI
MVTAKLLPGGRPGSLLDAQVASVGDARSLEGGILLLTPLYAANGLAVAAAQGALLVGGYTVTSGGDSTTKNHPTVGIVPRGASSRSFCFARCCRWRSRCSPPTRAFRTCC